ncbi:MAG TPA: cellulase family glycosylhydrolase [Armatimonadota bacterium]|nr:cellulase family glycosylhydrolase [Armatimonadota bacterium]
MRLTFLLLAVFLFMSAAISATQLPSPVIPDGMGVNIHFTGEPVRDLDMIKAGGWKFIRMDYHWTSIEKEKGVYNFSAYDQLTDALLKRGIRPLYILDYGNGLYNEPSGIRTEEGRQAFARFAAASVTHYKGKPILWELWNEPNGAGFWKPVPSAHEYMLLAKVVFPAIRKADPTAFCIAPATSGIDMGYLEGCFKEGLLQMVDGITVHPYRQIAPETVENDVQRLRALIAQYCPERPDLPILSGEWGYSCAWNGFNDTLQGQYLPRQYMMNLSLNIPLSIWYDWHDDGIDPKEPEHHFGTVTHEYQPKPSYLAAQSLVAALRGMHFVKRLQSAPDDYLFLFSDNKKFTMAAWTIADKHTVDVFPGKRVELNGDPQYIPVPDTATTVIAEGAWTVTVKSVGVSCGAAAKVLAPEFTVSVTNPFKQAIKASLDTTDVVNISGQFTTASSFLLQPGQSKTLTWKGLHPIRRDGAPLELTVAANINGMRSNQRVRFSCMNPISMSVVSLRQGGAAAMLRLPEKEPLTGTMTVQTGKNLNKLVLNINQAAQQYRASQQSGQATKQLSCFRIGGDVFVQLPGDVNFAQDAIRIQLFENAKLAADSGVYHIQPLEVSAAIAKAVNDGDLKVPATFTLTDTTFMDKDAPVDKGVRFAYEFGDGWKFVTISPKSEMKIEKAPQSIGVWVRGNKSNCTLRMRFVDSTGRFYQPTFGPLNFDGWRFMTVRMDKPTQMGQWGGTGTGKQIAYPITMNAFILVDGIRSKVNDTVDFADFQLIFPN